MICKGCYQDRKLIKAHIIPESFFIGHRVAEKSPLLMTDLAGVHPKKSRIGIYDKEILCSECEGRFQEVDDYGQTLLLKDESSHIELKKSNLVVGYQVNEVNYQCLKLFFISVLWRASISKHNFYSKIQLGSYESKAKEIIWSGNLGSKNLFSFFIAKFNDPDIGRVILDPHRERLDGVNYCRFYMYGYIIYIKVDKRLTPEKYRRFELNSNGVLYMVNRDISKSSELGIMQAIVNKKI